MEVRGQEKTWPQIGGIAFSGQPDQIYYGDGLILLKAKFAPVVVILSKMAT